MRKHIAFKPSKKHRYFVGYFIQYRAGKYKIHAPLYSSQEVPQLREEFVGELVNNLFKIFFVLANARGYQHIVVLVNSNGSLSVSINGRAVTVNPRLPYLILINKILRLYTKAIRAELKQKQQQFLDWVVQTHHIMPLPPLPTVITQRERIMYALGCVSGKARPKNLFTLLATPNDVHTIAVHDLDEIQQQFDTTIGAFTTTPRGKV